MVMQVRRTLTVGATPTGLAEGQISVGMADQPPIAWVGVPASVNPAGVIPITGLVRTVAGAPQPAGALGQLWWDEDAAQLFVYTGAEWVVAVNPPIPDLSQFVTQQALDDALAGQQVYTGPAPPPPPNSVGDLWFDTGGNQLMAYDGTNWVPSTQPLTGFVSKAGDTMSGALYNSEAFYGATVAGATAGVTGGFVGSWAQAAASNVGFYNANNALVFGNADAYGAVSGQRGSATAAGLWSLPAILSTQWQCTTSTTQFYWSFYGGNNLAWTNPAGQQWLMRWNPDNMVINGVGAVGGNGAYQNISDVRAKDDIEAETRGLETVLRLIPKKFRRIQGGTREVGFVANDVQDVLPEAVTQMGVRLADGGGELDSASPSLGMTDTPIIALLVNAVKELTCRLEKLEAR